MYKFCYENLNILSQDRSYRKIFEIFCIRNADLIASEYVLDKEIIKISYADYEYPVRYVADKLIKLLEDKPKNSFIAMKVDNCPEWPAFFWGILMSGYKPFLIDFRHGKDLTNFLIEEAGAVALLSTKQEDVKVDVILADDLLKINGREILDVIKDEKEKIYGGERAGESTVVSRIASYDWADEVALCTSGTTSTAKLYTYNGEAMGNQILTAKHIIKENQVILSDELRVNLAFLPFHHIFGLIAAYLWLSFFGKTQVYIKDRAPSTILSACRRHKVTNIMAVPILANNLVNGIKKKLAKQSAVKRFMFNLMCNISLFVQRISPDAGIKLAKRLFKNVHDVLLGSDVKCIILGGGHVLPETLRVINAIGYYTICGFGMTEVGIASVELKKDLKYRLNGALGTPVTSIEYKIVPFSDDNNIGELYIKGKSIHSGTVKGGQVLPPKVDEEGFFASGDIARLEDNTLFLEGRLKEVIINESGENVYPDELEGYFADLPVVSQICVLGVPSAPNSNYEDIVLVLEILGDLSEEEKIKLAKQIYKTNLTLPTFKKINKVLITKEPLPLANGIKVKRQALKQDIIEGNKEFVEYSMKDLKEFSK